MLNWICGTKKQTPKCGGKKLSKWEQSVTICQTCGHGAKNWTTNRDGSFRCQVCDGNPVIPDDGRPDWYEWRNAMMIAFFGPTIDGDLELLDKYREELDERGYL